MCSKIVVQMEAFKEMLLNQFFNKVLIILIHLITFNLLKITNILKLMLHYIFFHFFHILHLFYVYNLFLCYQQNVVRDYFVCFMILF
jgi:hypothetical protein